MKTSVLQGILMLPLSSQRELSPLLTYMFHKQANSLHKRLYKFKTKAYEFCQMKQGVVGTYT